MPNYRRAGIPGGTFFFTVVTDHRRRIFADPAARALLGSVFRRCRLRWPFEMPAIVLLPDHLHAMWSLPPGDADFSKRWGWMCPFRERHLHSRRLNRQAAGFPTQETGDGEQAARSTA